MSTTTLASKPVIALREALPDCPDAVVALVGRLLSQTSAELIARAVTRLEKPYGCNYVIARVAGHGISFMCMQPGQQTSLHYHERRREAFVVRAGSLELIGGQQRKLLKPGTVATSEPGIPHSLRNPGTELLEVLEIFSPPLMSDKVRVLDPYGRALGHVGIHQ